MSIASLPVRAWQVETHGEPAVALHCRETDPPVPAQGQVAVAVRACALNFADVLLCRGGYQQKPPLPFTPGLEVAGVRSDTGARVIALPALPHGGLAEQCLARVDDCLPIPDAVDDVSAAALTITYQTGWFGLFHRAALRPGETLLVHAGASGVGSAAIQLGKAAGARVLATAGGAAKVELCRQLGADDAIDYRAVDLIEAVRSLTGGRGVDVVYDPVGGDVFDQSRRVVASEGRIVVVGFASGRIPDIPANHVMLKNYSVVGIHWGWYREHSPALIRRAHDELVAWLADGRIAPLVMPERAFDDVPAALEMLAGRGAEGKVVVRVS